MRIETPHVCERLLTNNTRVRFFPRVHFQVRVKRRLRHKALPTITTQKRLLPVRQPMRLKEVLSLVRPRTNIAHVIT